MHMVIAPPTSGLDRQRVTRSGTWTPPAGGQNLVTGWVSDPAHPAVLEADQMVVTGSGPVTVSVDTAGAWTSMRILSLRVDGVEVATTTGTGTVSWSGDLSDGQRVGLWCGRTGSGSTITTASLDITPV